MLKGAWILPAIMLVTLIVAAIFPADVFAAENDEFSRPPPTRYKNLPGVVPEAERVEKDSFKCTAGIADVYIGRGRYDMLYGDTAPRRVYNCKTESGLTFSGTQIPNTQWVPGLNPLHLPK